MKNIITAIIKKTMQARKGGTVILLSKMSDMMNAAVFAIMPIPTLMTVLMIRLLRPAVLIRFGRMPSTRIGHFAANTEVYLCERDAGLRGRGTFDIFYHGKGPLCNYQLNRMFKRILPIFNYAGIIDSINRSFPGYEDHVVSLPHDRDINNLLAKTEPHLFFTDCEEEFGLREKGRIGLADGKPFICFHARDEAYLGSRLPLRDWSYHNFRNCDVSTYIPAAEELSRRGYYSIRMGALVKDALKTSDPNIVDYAIKYRTDFLDIYLIAKCRFLISSAAGIDAVAEVFRKPVVWVNFIPIEYLHSWNEKGLFIPKKLWFKKEKRFLTFREILNTGMGRLLHQEKYEEAGVEVIDNTPEEIKEVVLEMESRLGGSWRSTDEDESLQKHFRSLFKQDELNNAMMIRIGAKFLRDNKELLR